jgi:hypothetical protein
MLMQERSLDHLGFAYAHQHHPILLVGVARAIDFIDGNKAAHPQAGSALALGKGMNMLLLFCGACSRKGLVRMKT